MDAAGLTRTARHRGGMSQRALGRAAGTSHSTIAAYEAGRREPSFEAVIRILRAAGYELQLELRPVVGGVDRASRGRELVDALELAAQFPARHDRFLDAPVFGRSSSR